MKIFLVLNLLSLGLYAQALKPQEVFSLVFKNKDVKLDSSKNAGCDPTMGKTIGEYVAFLLGTVSLAHAKDKVKINARCETLTREKTSMFEPPKGSLKPQECTIQTMVVDHGSGDPWNYEFRFRLKSDGKDLDPAFMACPGTP